MNQKTLKNQIIELYKQTASQIPSDVAEALIAARKREKPGSLAFEVYSVILENLKQAEITGRPMCQDTGTPAFYIKFGKDGFDLKVIKAIQEATDEATKQVPLRHNAVRVSDNKNMGTNIPEIHIDFWDKPTTEINLLLKGGGSENVSQVHKLTGSERNEEGILRAALKTVFEAQGKGCSPGILGIAVAGTQVKACEEAKKQLLRKVREKSTSLETKIKNQVNKLGIGPLGLGGKTTILDVFIKDLDESYRHPASYFVAISYMCYADRRGKLIIRNTKARIERKSRNFNYPKFTQDFKRYNRVLAPIDKNYQLKVGDRVLLTGEITTARDRAHKYLLETNKKLDISNVIYHCGILADCNQCIAAAGPTTSARMDEYQNQIIKKYDIKAIIGKGGMNKLEKGAIYFEGFGGVGAMPAKLMRINKGYKKDFGMPEAIWNIEVKEPGIPLLVTMDAKGESLYDKVEKKSEKIYDKLMKEHSK
ncbi:fumarate hydratase [Patescibacteria group bacterium]|nr:fumarate hydratase [Patescibacteria group bacterium]MBU1673779.1 fumarate hydratase [Patescibacteria group bacterium]MBU1964119.1 fumarate hydratase [Patescibacteria group bacterium]